VELALLAFLPQVLIFFIPQTSQLVSPQWAAFVLPLSLGILVLFLWFNRHLSGFWLLGVGLLLNMAVIVANDGLMPISPETLAVVHGTQEHSTGVEGNIESQAIGDKNIVLRVEDTRLEWLGDRFTVPDQWPIQFAYSLGDLFLALGAFWVLWAGGATRGASRQDDSGVILERHVYSTQKPEGTLER
jgi:hypothetical protein